MRFAAPCRVMTLLAMGLLLSSPAALAKPQAYAMDKAGSTVAYATDFGKTPITGTMPVLTADMILDFDQVANSRVTVTLNARGATSSLPFAAQALKAPSVLDTAHHPTLSFRSTKVVARGDGARVTGDLTIRGVTRPITLDAQIWRQQGTEAGDRSRLTIRLTGAVSRSAFGASGWADAVADEVRIDIRARVSILP